MSIIIFFGFALCVFTAGVIVISLTLFHWYKLHRDGNNNAEKNQKNSEQSAEAAP